MRYYLALLLLSSSSWATTITNSSGDTLYINRTTAGYSSVEAQSGKITNYITSPQGLTVIHDQGQAQTFMVSPAPQDASGDPVILVDQIGEE